MKELFGVGVAGRRPVRAPHVVGFDFKTGNGVGSAIGTEQQAVVSLVTIGQLGRGVDANHAAPHDAGLVAEHVFIQQVAACVRGFVRLLRVVRQQLPVGGERHAVDFSGGACSVERDFLVNVGQAGANSA